MKLIPLVTTTAAALALAGCMSSSPEDLDSVGKVQRANGMETFNLLASADSLAPPADDLMNGTARLTGALVLDDINDPGEPYGEARGNMTMDANFTNGTISASVSNIAQYEGTGENASATAKLPGSLALNGTISGTGFVANGSGVLQNEEALNMAISIKGDFYDYNGVLAAKGTATADVNNEQQFDGRFGVIAQ